MKHIIITTIAAVLLVGCGGASGIQKAAISGNIEAVKQYLDGGADVNAMDDFGRIPLHLAAWKGHKEIAELLIANGADVNAQDKYGRTPLDWAVMLGKPEIADLLRKHGGKTKKELEAEAK